MTRKRKIAVLFLIPPLMFGFGYLMVPIYDVFCDLTGLNGKTGSITVQRVEKMQVDESRMIKVEFMAVRNHDTPMDFAPTVRSIMAHPGKPYQTMYRARNRQHTAMVGQAVPSVSPSKAAAYFNKTECFCFGQQAFKALESRELPLVFVIHPNLPENIDTITLSYTFFAVDADQQQNQYNDSTHDHSTHDHRQLTAATPTAN